MHILVTGGAGFIGSHSVDLALAAGHQVRVLDNFYSGHRANLTDHPRLTVIEGDIRDPATVHAAMADITHVLHLAAQVFVPTSIEQPAFSSSVNVTGFVNVLDAVPDEPETGSAPAESVQVGGHSKDEMAVCCLEAHRFLMALKPENSAKFKAVTEILEQQLQEPVSGG